MALCRILDEGVISEDNGLMHVNFYNQNELTDSMNLKYSDLLIEVSKYIRHYKHNVDRMMDSCKSAVLS